MKPACLAGTCLPRIFGLEPNYDSDLAHDDEDFARLKALLDGP